MNKIYVLNLLLVAAMITLLTACGGGDDDGGVNADCTTAEEIWGGSNKTKSLGEECFSGSYGTCPYNYDDCLEGSCIYSDSANTDICTITCASNSDCGGDYCKDGICQPAASCTTFCDGTICCPYINDPNDPTKCILGGDCWFQ